MAWNKNSIKEYINKTQYELINFKIFDGLNSVILIRCKKCEEVYEIKFSNFKRKKDKNYCKNCEFINKKNELTNKCLEFANNINYKVLNVFYKNERWFVELQCNNGHTPYTTRVEHFLSNHLCRQCANESLIVWDENTIKEAIEKEKYQLIEILENKGYESKISIWCGNKNHNPYTTYFSEFQKNHRCRRCYSVSKIKWKKEDIICYIEKEKEKFIDFIEYNGFNSTIKILCEKHGEYKIRFDHFIEGQRCPICKESKGEKKIRENLEKLNIEFEHQYTFKDCKCYKELPFDFYLPQYNMVIEYDGELHYQVVDYFGGLDKFIDIKIRDTIKTEYCKNNNIKLIRIPYWNFKNIEKIICQEFN